jgi:hypothetical protein
MPLSILAVGFTLTETKLGCNSRPDAQRCGTIEQPNAADAEATALT